MKFDRQPTLTQNTEAEFESELLDCLLAPPANNYPWNPGDPETVEYYINSDREFNLDDWTDEEIGERSQSFFTQIQSCWADTPTPEVDDSPLDLLTIEFGSRVPQQWLEAIATKVSSIIGSNLEPAEQLVNSVQDLLSNWAIDDLFVMARPYAYAMRCDPGVNDPDRIVRPLNWLELSEVERAKLTILIAQYAIDATKA
jgi:hypothetical protein